MNRLQFSVLLVILTCLVLSTANLMAQSDYYRYIGSNGKITDRTEARKMERVISKSARKTTVQIYLKSDGKWTRKTTDRYKLVNDSTYRISENSSVFKGAVVRTFSMRADGLYQFNDEINGRTVRRGTAKTLVPLVLQGEVTEYYKNGNKKSVSAFEDNQLKTNRNWNEDGEKYIDNIFYSVDVDPSFVPGAKTINQTLIRAFKTAGIDVSQVNGSLVVGFVVTETGKIDGIKIIKGLGTNINNVVYETFANLRGDWIPARLDDRAVRYFQVFPINFINKTQSLEFAELRGSTLHWAAF